MTHTVPILHIDRNNLSRYKPVLLAALKASDILSIDLELSGLGAKPGISSKNLKQRYKAMKNAAEQYSIISIGICTFTNDKHCSIFQLNVSKPDINLNRDTAKFLLDHGFDFDQLYRNAADYNKNHNNCVNAIIREIFQSGRPIVFHNGLLDMCHIYSSFIGDLPASLEKFTQIWASILDKGRCSILDSKLISRGLFQLKFSTLGFCYLWSSPNMDITYPYSTPRRDSCSQSTENSGYRSEFGPSMSGEEHDSITWLKIELDSATRFSETEKKLCPRFKKRAFCSYQPCKLNHNIRTLVDEIKETRKRRREKRRDKKVKIMGEPGPKKIKFGSSSESESDVDENSSNEINQRENANFDVSKVENSTIELLTKRDDLIGTTGAHGASIDAFMALYSITSLLTTETPPKPNVPSPLPNGYEKLEPYRNRLNGPNPNTGFLISKSSFVKLLDVDHVTIDNFVTC